jgi:hypothetical protein
MASVGTTVPAEAAASFVPWHNGLAGQPLSFAPLRIRETRPAELVSQSPLLQTKLVIGEPDDEYEREADRVAQTLMRMPEPAVQRKPG